MTLLVSNDVESRLSYVLHKFHRRKIEARARCLTFESNYQVQFSTRVANFRLLTYQVPGFSQSEPNDVDSAGSRNSFVHYFNNNSFSALFVVFDRREADLKTFFPHPNPSLVD